MIYVCICTYAHSVRRNTLIEDLSMWNWLLKAIGAVVCVGCATLPRTYRWCWVDCFASWLNCWMNWILLDLLMVHIVLGDFLLLFFCFCYSTAPSLLYEAYNNAIFWWVSICRDVRAFDTVSPKYRYTCTYVKSTSYRLHPMHPLYIISWYLFNAHAFSTWSKVGTYYLSKNVDVWLCAWRQTEVSALSVDSSENDVVSRLFSCDKLLLIVRNVGSVSFILTLNIK